MDAMLSLLKLTYSDEIDKGMATMESAWAKSVLTGGENRHNINIFKDIFIKFNIPHALSSRERRPNRQHRRGLTSDKNSTKVEIIRALLEAEHTAQAVGPMAAGGWPGRSARPLRDA